MFSGVFSIKLESLNRLLSVSVGMKSDMESKTPWRVFLSTSMVIPSQPKSATFLDVFCFFIVVSDRSFFSIRVFKWSLFLMSETELSNMACSLFTYCVVGVTNLDEERKMSKFIDEKNILKTKN